MSDSCARISQSATVPRSRGDSLGAPGGAHGKGLGILAGMNSIGSLSTYTVQSVDIAHLIQIALTPIFLISAIGVTLNVLTSRLARIVDRARATEDVLRRPDHTHDGRDLHGVLSVLARRARYINAAITLITLSALFISLVVVMLFVNAFLRWDLSVFIACMFILSMLSLAAALSAFLIEVRVATNTLQIGIEAAEAADAASRHDE